MSKISVAILLLVTSINCLQAEQNTVSAGGKASGIGGSMSYSIGQIVYSQNKGNTGSSEQGLQHSYEILTVSSAEHTMGINLAISSYPNPTDCYIILKIESSEITDLVFQLFDLHGKLLINKKLSNNESNIDIKHLASATYYLRVTKNKSIIKTFKIIKN